MVKSKHIHFVLEKRLVGQRFGHRELTKIDYSPEPEQSLRFTVTPPTTEDDYERALELKTYLSVEVSDAIWDFVDAYLSERVLIRTNSSITLPYLVGGSVVLDRNGAFPERVSPSLFTCPEDIIEFLEGVKQRLNAYADRFTKLMRWRQGYPANDDEASNAMGSLFWNVGSSPENYYHVPTGKLQQQTIKVSAISDGMQWSNSDQLNMTELWQSVNLDEPLGHTLLKEAATQLSNSPRSAILIMTAALETSTKTHISEIAPDCSWLMESIASPPIFKILKDYIPRLHKERGTDMDFWDGAKPLLKVIQRLVEVRNKVAHTGKIPKLVEPLDDYLLAVNDILYVLDALKGYEWAKSLVSRPVAHSLGWPESKHHVMTITIKHG